MLSLALFLLSEHGDFQREMISSLFQVNSLQATNICHHHIFFFPTAQSWCSEKTWSLFLSVKYHFMEFSLYQFQLSPSAMDNLFYMLLLLSVTSTRLPMEHNLQLFFHSCPFHINLSPDLFHIRGNLLSLFYLLTVSHMPLLYKKLFESKIKWISHLLGKIRSPVAVNP